MVGSGIVLRYFNFEQKVDPNRWSLDHLKQFHIRSLSKQISNSVYSFMN